MSNDYALAWEECGRDPQLAARLNAEFRTIVEYLLSSGRRDLHPPLLGNLGPRWFRPPLEGREHLLRGPTQIAGHTPCKLPGVVAELRDAGIFLIDPDVLGDLPPDERDKYRYAVIEGGQVRVEAGKVD